MTSSAAPALVHKKEARRTVKSLVALSCVAQKRGDAIPISIPPPHLDDGVLEQGGGQWAFGLGGESQECFFLLPS